MRAIRRASGASPSREEAYQLIARIPSSRVVSYAQLSRVLGVHPRVIGRWLARSPGMPRVPCHRVVHADGRLGGYAFGGPRAKRALLEAEGVRFCTSERVCPESFLPDETVWELGERVQREEA